MKGIVDADFNTPEGREVFRHSAAHLMAAAVKALFQTTKLGVGPALENSFYYDFDLPETVTPEVLEKIEKKMEELVRANFPFVREELPKKEAIDLFTRVGEPYKVELIQGIADDKVSIYRTGDFVDLCRGPHLPSTGKIRALKLLSVAGAYWRGSETNPMMQRIYGTCFDTDENLQKYLKTLEEAKRRDHRKLGKELGLFSFHDEGPGMPFWRPKGMALRNALIDYWREEHRKAGYLEIQTPIILRQKLWETSGHMANFRENMYLTEIDEEGYAIKPMNCPGAMLVYKETIHSYRELPLRLGELGLVHRHERSGVLQGLFRVRSFTQDDAHIFITPSQIKSEIIEIIHLIDKFYKTFGFDYEVDLSTRPDKHIGSEEQWEKATAGLEEALKELDLPYSVMKGSGAFYGPKIDFQLIDSLGRPHQCATVQLDMAQPERFDLKFRNSDGKDERPYILHRVVYGSLERFIGILVEHYAGFFPTWLSPIQVRLLTVTDAAQKYAHELYRQFLDAGLRCELDEREEKIGLKIRESEKEKIPYMGVVGEKEAQAGTLSVRKHKAGDQGAMKPAEFLAQLKKEITEKIQPPMELFVFQKRSAAGRAAVRDY